MSQSLTERERQVLEAVIETYVETAEPAGSRTISRRSGMMLSAATIRNTMSDLEEKGFLYHPHTSAGRIPTDLAYRVYVDSLMRLPPVSLSDSDQIREELTGERTAVDRILERAAQVLGVLTKELGVAVGPSLDGALLERLALLQISSERPLLALWLKRDLLRQALAQRLGDGLTITIGSEHRDSRLAPFTLVTASYRLGALSGVIGVLGPTRMAYDKIVALVDHTSRLVGELLE